MVKSDWNTVFKNSSVVVFGLLYACFFVLIPHDYFKDRGNYLTIYAEWFDVYFDSIVSPTKFFFTEPLFFYFNKWLYVFRDPSLTVSVFVFINLFLTFSFCGWYTKNLFLFILLLGLLFFNPQYFALQFTTIRQGLAVVLMLLFYDKFKFRYGNYALLFLLSLIHTSFYIVLLFVGIYEFFKYFFAKKSFDFIIYLLIGVGIVFNSMVLILSRYLSVKEEYYSLESDGSGGMFFVLTAVFIYLFYVKRRSFTEQSIYKKYYELALIGLVVYLTGYFLSPISGRLIGTFLPFIYLSLIYRMKDLDIFVVIFLLFLNVLLFFYGGAEIFMVKSLGDVADFYRFYFNVF